MAQTDGTDRQVRRVIMIEGAANFVVLLAKLAVGLTTGSLAILSDAVHSLTDVVNNVLAWFVVPAVLGGTVGLVSGFVRGLIDKITSFIMLVLLSPELR